MTAEQYRCSPPQEPFLQIDPCALTERGGKPRRSPIRVRSLYGWNHGLEDVLPRSVSAYRMAA